MRNAQREMMNANYAIENSLNSLSVLSRGVVSQSIVNNLRNLVEHIAVFAIYGDEPVSGDYYSAIQQAIHEMKRNADTKFIWDFHYLLQKVVSHYTPSEESSERLLIKYYENLILLKKFLRDKFEVSILSNLAEFPIDLDPGLSEYYFTIASRVDEFMCTCSPNVTENRYYVRSVKPFFVDERVYYELTLMPAFDFSSKFDHSIAFSSFRVPTNFAVSLSFKNTSIKKIGATIPITVVDSWTASLRPCEINNLIKVFGLSDVVKVTGRFQSYRSLMRFLTSRNMSLYELVALPSPMFEEIYNSIKWSGVSCPVHALLKSAHEFLATNKSGSNVLRCLLHNPRNIVIKDQLQDCSNNKLGGLYLQNGCIPFDKQPYCTSLLRHQVSARSLYLCIDPDDYVDNHLARFVSANAQATGFLYLSDSEVAHFGDIDKLISCHNSALYCTHTSRKLVHEMGQIFVKGDEDSAVMIIKDLLTLSRGGLRGYSSTCESWLSQNPRRVDDPAKRDTLVSMFSESKVALIYGSAGTGKTTMVDHVCSALSGVRKIAIANTNPAVDSLRRRISDNECSFMTIAKYLNSHEDCAVLIVDECSTVSNQDFEKILRQKKFKLLVLVGDLHQIEAIRLGNWFELAREFIPKNCIHEFETPWRASTKDLATLWTSVRNNSNDITELLETYNMTATLDESVYQRQDDDEIVLCLNYDGLYGINSMNKLIQSSNPNESFNWNQHIYKAGDPILFNESNRFYPLLYNNLKGEIIEISSTDEEITFTVAVDLSLNELSVIGFDDLDFLDNVGGKTHLRFSVKAHDDPDEEEQEAQCIVPFQVAYAVSIHKAQGLEYSSVKVIITKDAEKRITHNIFYTAITRAKNKLKIFWSPESQEAIISSFILTNHSKDAHLLSKRYGIELVN